MPRIGQMIIDGCLRCKGTIVFEEYLGDKYWNCLCCGKDYQVETVEPLLSQKEEDYLKTYHQGYRQAVLDLTGGKS